MSDLVQRLRNPTIGEAWECGKLIDEAADEIEQLWKDNGYTANELGKAQAEIARLRTVLKPLLEHYLDCYGGNRDQLALDAERLLNGGRNIEA